MAKRTRRPKPDPVRGFAEHLVERLIEHRWLLGALTAMRAMGPEGAAATDAVLALQPVRVLRGSIELWEGFTAADGLDPVAALDRYLPPALLDELWLALWDEPRSAWRSRVGTRYGSPK